MMIDLLVVSCTTKNEITKFSTKIHKWYKEIESKYPNIKLDLILNNKDGLAKAYNKKIEQYKDSNIPYILFVHDDVYIDDLKLVNKIEIAHTKLGYDIIGIGGGLNPVVKYPTLWHIMCSPENRRGYASHTYGENQIMASGFGPMPSRVAIADGVFLAVHLPTVIKSEWRFNENYTFHHYDIASCIDANRKRLKIGVYPIHIIHDSTGLKSLDDPIWSKSNEIFLKEYSK